MFESVNQTFNSIFKESLKGGLKNAIHGVCSSENNTILSFLIAQMSNVRNSVDRSNQVIQLFSLVADKISSSEDAVIDILTEDITDVTDRMDMIVEGCQFIHQQYGNMTFTDSFGLLYNMFFDTKQFSVNGLTYTAYLRTCLNPSSVHDCLFYYDHAANKFMFNAVARTADFANYIGPVDDGVITHNLQAYCNYSHVNFNGTMLNGYSGTILEYFEELSGATGDIQELSRLIVPPSFVAGKVRYLWDLVKEYMMSAELNSVLADAISSLSQGEKGFVTWLSTISAQITSKVDCVKQFFNGICNAYTSGGFKGVLMYVYEYFKTASSATDEDGLLKFTDNNNLVPIEYIVGMIGQIVSTAVAAAGAIITYFQPLIGAMVTAIGGVAYGIFKSISYDESRTRCSIQTSDRVSINAAPYAITQGEMDLDPESDLAKYINSNPIFVLEIPGGYLLCGPGAYGDGNIVTKLRFEFHPSLDNHYNDIMAFAGSVVARYDTTSVVSTTTITQYHAGTNQSYVVYDKDLIDAWLNDVYFSPDHVSSYIMANQSDGALSSNDDGTMKQIIISNLWLFIYWATAQYNSMGPNFKWYAHDKPGENFFLEYRKSSASESVIFSMEALQNAVIALAPLDPLSNESLAYLKPAWTVIVSIITAIVDSELLAGVVPQIITSRQYMGLPISLPNSFDYALVPAKYDSSTFLTWIILSAVVTVAVATVTVAVTMKVRKAIQAKRADQNRNVEAAWDEYKKGNISYDDYRKTVRTANRWHMLVGGTKYDYENYWNGDVSVPASVSSDSHSTLSGIKSMLNAEQNTVTIDGKEVGVNELLTMTLKSIIG